MVTHQQSSAPSWAHATNIVVVVAAAYAITGWLGMLLAIPPGYASAVWPPSGIALAAVLLAGRPAIVGAILGSFFASLLYRIDQTTWQTVLESAALQAVLAAGAGLQVAIGAALVRRFVADPSDLTRERDILALILLGGPVSCLSNASYSVFLLWLFGVVPSESVAYTWWTWWLGDTMAVPIFTPLVLIAVQTPPAQWRRRQIYVSLPLAITFSLVVALFVVSHRREQQTIEDQFHDQAQTLANDLDRRLTAALRPLTALRAACEAYGTIDAARFRHLSQTVMGVQSGVKVLGWARFVTDADRPRFEAALQEQGGLAIRDLGPESTFIPARIRESYIAVEYLDPLEDNRHLLGFNLESVRNLRNALSRATVERQASVTERITLLTPPPQPGSVIVVEPVFQIPVPGVGDEPPGPLVGFLVCGLDLESLIHAALPADHREGLHLELVDVSGPDASRTLFDTPEQPDMRIAPWQSALLVGGRTWMFIASPTSTYFVTHRSQQAWSLLAGGMLFTGLLGAFLLVLTGRGEAIERQVADQTTELNNQRQFVEAITEAVPGVVYIVDLAAGQVVYANRNLEEMFGVVNVGMFGAGVMLGSELHSDDRLAIESHGRRIAQAHDGEIDTIEYRTLKPTGEVIWLSISETVFRRRPDGSVRQIIGVAQDITQTKAAEQEVRDFNTLIRAVVDAFPGLISVKDLESRYLLMNRHQADLFGTTVEDVKGRRDEDLISAEYGAYTAVKDRKVMETGQRLTFEETTPDAAGHLHTWQTTKAPLHGGPDGTSIRGIVNVSIDIGERVAAEQSLRESLHQREVLLKEVHHRVKNNLQVITSLLALQGRYGGKDDHLTTILRDSQDRIRAMALVHENLYRTGDLARVHVREYLDALVQQLLRSHALHKDGKVKVECQVNDLTLEIDQAVPCGLILNELVSNCLKHAFPDERQGRVTVMLNSSDAERVTLVVQDDGVGLPPPQCSCVPQSLGIQLIHRLAQQLGGQADLVSRNGTRAEVEFPLRSSTRGENR